MKIRCTTGACEVKQSQGTEQCTIMLSRQRQMSQKSPNSPAFLSKGMRRHGYGLLVTFIGVMLTIVFPPRVQAEDHSAKPIKQAQVPNPWPALIQQANERGLPTTFLKHIDPTFVTVVFEDLHTYAAEYHPPQHRMILNMRPVIQ